MDNQANDGAIAPADDNALFSETISPEAERPEPSLSPQEQTPPAGQQPVTPTPQPQQSEATVPSARLREEMERARNAERDRDRLQGQLEAFMRQQQPKQEPKAAPDIFENAPEAIRHTVAPQFEQFEQTLLAIAKDSAIGRFTEKTVDEAEKAFIAAMQSRTLDPADYQRVVHAPNRYAAAVQWHQRQIVQQEVGGDPAAYKNRILEEALKDPEFQKRAVEAFKGAAQQSGNNVIRTPASQPHQTIPSLSRVGATALPEGQDEASDEELFAATTRRKRSASG